jgi:hypothetical protein
MKPGEDDEEDQEKVVSLPWYMVNGDGSGIKSWDFFIIMITIYSMFVTPFIMVYPYTY